MTAQPLLPFALAAALGAALPAAAQHASSSNSITLYGGARAGSGFEQANPPNDPIDMRSGAAGSVGIEWPYDPGRRFQLFMSYQRTELDLGGSAAAGSPATMPLQIAYVHIGGLNYFAGPVGTGPYVVGGLGATLMNPSLPGTSARVRPSLNVGLGYEWPLAQAVALRTELRGYWTLLDSSGSFFCSGGCVVQIRGTAMAQFEAMVGLTFGF